MLVDRFSGCLIAAALLFPNLATAHQPHVCPAGIPDAPVLPGHIEQDDINSGAWSLDMLRALGHELFVAKFNACDGHGRPLTTGVGEPRVDGQPAFTRISGNDSSACASCHNDPVVGGAGDFVANVFVLGQAADPILTTIDPLTSNERNTLGMHGAAAIEMLAREMSADLQAQAAALGNGRHRLETKGVHFDIEKRGDVVVRAEGIDTDLIIKPFHQAGVVTSIRQFTLNAMNHHHGMQAEERFEFVGKGPDFDGDGIGRELTVGDITAVTLFQAALGNPGQDLPQNANRRRAIERGERLFGVVGCTECHKPALLLDSRIYVEPNPYNPAGTLADLGAEFSFDMTREGGTPRLERMGARGAIVRAFTDLKRHNLCDFEIDYFCNERLDQNRPELNGEPGHKTFITRKLWDAGSSAPYGHRGDLTTLYDAIAMHGGEARASRDRFLRRRDADQKAIIAFLKSLKVSPDGEGF